MIKSLKWHEPHSDHHAWQVAYCFQEDGKSNAELVASFAGVRKCCFDFMAQHRGIRCVVCREILLSHVKGKCVFGPEYITDTEPKMASPYFQAALVMYLNQLVPYDDDQEP